MDFYESITKYYDYIFPLKKPQVDFAFNVASEVGAESLLDIGCATGAFACQMGQGIDEVNAFDLDAKMAELAKSRCNKPNVQFVSGNMLYLDKMYGEKSFDIITCFGNTLVHLAPTDLDEVFASIKRHLSVKGVFLMQILNYDYVLSESIQELPLIDNEMITFKRYYNLANTEKILFETILNIKKTGEEIKNEISLYPIGKNQLDATLKKAGFCDVSYYKNYNAEPASGAHLPLIVKAR